MKWMRYTARTLVILWAAFWILFAVGSALSGGGGRNISMKEQLKGILAVSGIIAIALGGIYLAFRRERVSGVCLTFIGLLTIFLWFINLFREGFAFSSLWIMLVMGGPPLAAGIFFLLSSWKTKKAH